MANNNSSFEYQFGDPHFLTNKLRILNISQSKNVYDYQLKDHFLNHETLRQLQCNCANHKHNKMPCTIVTGPICLKCKTPTSEVINFQSFLFHPELATKHLLSCCTHVHEPPCRRCINCQTNMPCVVTTPFECSVSTGLYRNNNNNYSNDVIFFLILIYYFFLNFIYIYIIIIRHQSLNFYARVIYYTHLHNTTHIKIPYVIWIIQSLPVQLYQILHKYINIYIIQNLHRFISVLNMYIIIKNTQILNVRYKHLNAVNLLY